MSGGPARGAARLDPILDALPDAVLVVNCNGTVVSANRVALEVFQCPGTGLIGRGLLSLLPSFDSNRIPGSPQLAERPAPPGAPARMPAVRTDGSEFTVEVSSSLTYDDHGYGPSSYGTLPGDGDMLVLVVRDLSERADTEAELRRQQKQTETILRSAGEGIIGVDRDGCVVLVNPSATKLLGFRASDLGGAELLPIVAHSRPDGSPRPVEENPLHDTLLTGRRHRVRETVLWQQNGEPLDVELRTTPVREDDQLVGAVLAFTDRSEVLALTRQHLQLTTVLENELHGALARMHQQLADLASDAAAALWPEANRVLKHLSGESSRVSRMVSDMVAHQQLETGQEPIDRRSVGIDRVLNDAVSIAVQLVGGGRARFAVHTAPFDVVVDTDRLAQAVGHLIADTVRAQPASEQERQASSAEARMPAQDGSAGGASVVVTAAQRGETVRIEVRGPALNSDSVHVPLARGVVERHGGVLQAHELPDRGCTYVVELPLVPEEGTDPDRQSRQDRAARHGGVPALPAAGAGTSADTSAGASAGEGVDGTTGEVTTGSGRRRRKPQDEEGAGGAHEQPAAPRQLPASDPLRQSPPPPDPRLPQSAVPQPAPEQSASGLPEPGQAERGEQPAGPAIPPPSPPPFMGAQCPHPPRTASTEGGGYPRLSEHHPEQQTGSFEVRSLGAQSTGQGSTFGAGWSASTAAEQATGAGDDSDDGPGSGSHRRTRHRAPEPVDQYVPDTSGGGIAGPSIEVPGTFGPPGSEHDAGAAHPGSQYPPGRQYSPSPYPEQQGPASPGAAYQDATYQGAAHHDTHQQPIYQDASSTFSTPPSPGPTGHSAPVPPPRGRRRRALQLPESGSGDQPRPGSGSPGAPERTEDPSPDVSTADGGVVPLPHQASVDGLRLPGGPLDPDGAGADFPTMVAPTVDGGPRPLLVWPEPDASTSSALQERGFRPTTVSTPAEMSSHADTSPAALFVDPLTGTITRTALQSLRDSAVAKSIPVLVTAGLGQATREAAYGADPAVLLRAVAPQDGEGHSARVLLVESDPDIAAAFTTTLQRRGMHVVHAASEADAVSVATSVEPNLVVMDLMLIRRRRVGIVDWLRGGGSSSAENGAERLHRTPLVVYTSVDMSTEEKDRLRSGETVLFLAERSTRGDVQHRIVDLLSKMGTPRAALRQ